MHDLIKENQIIKSHDFGTTTPPTLDPKKGTWVPRNTINPDYDSTTQTKTGPVKTVNEDSTTWTYSVEDIPIETLKTNKLAEIRAASDSKINELTYLYSDSEKSSWVSQEKEAIAWTADSTVETPLLSAMASARGIELSDLVIRVLINATMFSTASGAILGKQQRLEDVVDAAETADEVVAVAWV